MERPVLLIGKSPSAIYCSPQSLHSTFPALAAICGKRNSYTYGQKQDKAAQKRPHRIMKYKAKDFPATP